MSDEDVLAIFNGYSNPRVLDLACAFYICPNQSLFATYEIVLICVMVTRNNAPCLVVDIGRVGLKLLDGTIRTLDQLQHVPY